MLPPTGCKKKRSKKAASKKLPTDEEYASMSNNKKAMWHRWHPDRFPYTKQPAKIGICPQCGQSKKYLSRHIREVHNKRPRNGDKQQDEE